MKRKINDPDMKLSARTTERWNFFKCTEASAGANGGKSGGGCGCNVLQIFDFNSNSIKMKIKNYSTLSYWNGNCICTRYKGTCV
jgi:hypothetical protein